MITIDYNNVPIEKRGNEIKFALYRLKIGEKIQIITLDGIRIYRRMEWLNELFKWYVIKFPKAAKMLFGWDPKSDSIETADFTSFSKLIEVVKIFPKK